VLILLLLAPGAARAQWEFDVRAGVAGSSALLEDQVASPRLAQQLGGSFEGEVRARAALGPMVTAAARTGLNPRFAAELNVGWTASTLQAEDAAGTRDLQGLGVGHATLGVRTLFGPRISGNVGFGAIRYFADEEGIFAEGSDLSPLLEAGATVTVWRAVTVRVTGQAHTFSNPFIRVLNGQDGSVFRWAVQAGWTFGGRP
jgi:hypothetical protein